MDDTPFLQRLLTRRMLVIVLLGFASGMPLFVLIQLLPAWMEAEGVDVTTTTLTYLTGLPYTWKFLWSPVLDRFVLPFLGRRRGWMLFFQVLLAVTVGAIGFFDPTQSLPIVVALATSVAFFSASQDIVIDAYRRELLPDIELGLGNAIHINAYRAAGLVPGSLALILADSLPWSAVFPIVGAFMVLGALGTFLAPLVNTDIPPPRTLASATIEPLREFLLQRDGLPAALLTLGFLLLYKLGDTMATAPAYVFYQQIGFTLTEVGTVAKVVGLTANLVGAFVGGALMTRIGINRALWIFGLVQLVSILGFAALAEIGHDITALSVAVAFEYLGVGLGTAALVAFMARECDRRFTATQFALLSSLVALPRTLAGAATGWLSVQLGWTGFFLLCTGLAIPGLLMLPLVAPWNAPDETRAA